MRQTIFEKKCAAHVFLIIMAYALSAVAIALSFARRAYLFVFGLSSFGVVEWPGIQHFTVFRLLAPQKNHR